MFRVYLNGIYMCMLSETGNWQADVDFQSRKIRHTFITPLTVPGIE